MVGATSPHGGGESAGTVFPSTDSAESGKGGMGTVKPTQSFSYHVFQASFWRRFWLLARPFWARPLRGKTGSFADGSGAAWGLLGLLIALIFGTTALLVKLNFQQGEALRLNTAHTCACVRDNCI